MLELDIDNFHPQGGGAERYFSFMRGVYGHLFAISCICFQHAYSTYKISMYVHNVSGMLEVTRLFQIHQCIDLDTHIKPPE